MKSLLPLLLLFVSLCPLTAQIEWDRQYPLDKLEDVLDIDISDDGYGFASGTDGLLLRLDPSSNRWDLISGVGLLDANYESIDYLDSSNGTTALAGGQQLIMTVDGGETWNEILLAPADIRSVKIYSATHLMVIAKDGAYSWQDGGWTDLADPAASTIEGGFILDENHMWLWTSAASSPVYYTSNGGDSWSANSDIADVDVLKFFDANNGIATDGRKVFSTANGGGNWVLVSENEIHNSSNDITFGTTANVVMAATFNADPTISLDGGATWEKFGTGLLNQRSFSIESISDSEFYVGNDLSSIVWTEDQGENWIETSGPERSIVQDAVFVTRTTGFAVGQSGMFLRTFNGGVQWENLSFGARSHFSISGVDASDLWIGTSQRILHSTDMGETWTEAGLFPSGNITEVFAISSTRILAGSSSGEVYRSNNGGVTWDTVYHAGVQIRSIAKADANTYLITGFNGLILRSTNQGDNWVALTPPAPGLQYEDISFLNGEGWMVTSSFKKEMWYTSDFGSSWDTITLPIDRFWDGVYFMSSDTGVIVGRNNSEGRAYVTYTGGQTWNPGYVLPFPLYGVTGIPHPNGTAWIYGYGSDIERLSFCNTFPVISDFTGDLSLCENATVLYTVQSENIDDFIWDIPGTWSFVGESDNDSIFVITGASGGVISVIGQNGCGFSQQFSFQTEVTNLPVVSNLAGDALPCFNAEEIYSVVAENINFYVWTLPADWSITGNPNSNIITVSVGQEPGTMAVHGSNICGTSGTATIEVEPFVTPDANIITNGDVLSLSASASNYQWYLDGVLIPGANNASYLATEDGDYYASLTFLPAQCTSFSDTISHVVTSVSHNPQVEINVYPVPTSDELYIMGINGSFHYVIADVFGQMIIKGTSATGKILVAHLSDGMYILNIDQDDRRMMAKFIRQ